MTEFIRRQPATFVVAGTGRAQKGIVTLDNNRRFSRLFGTATRPLRY